MMCIAFVYETRPITGRICVPSITQNMKIVLHTLNLCDFPKAYFKLRSEELHETPYTFPMNTIALDFADKFYFSTKNIPLNV